MIYIDSIWLATETMISSNRGIDDSLAGSLRQYEHGVAHHQRWLDQIHDDRLAVSYTADQVDGFTGGFGELINVGAGAGTCGFLIEAGSPNRSGLYQGIQCCLRLSPISAAFKRGGPLPTL